MANFGDQPQLTRTEEFREYPHTPGEPQHGLRPPPESLQQDAGIGANLRRSGSSSSSSSEDDGEGGRRKKGMKDKIKDKLHRDVQGQQGDSRGPDGYSKAEDHGEKKGFVDKIKDKLHGNH